MNKAMKRRQKRKERDLRWVEKCKVISVFGRHRHKKVHGLPKMKDGKRSAFWCNETDSVPLIARLWRGRVGCQDES